MRGGGAMILRNLNPQQRIIIGVELIVGVILLGVVLGWVILNQPGRQPTPTPAPTIPMGTEGALTPLPISTSTPVPTRRLPSATPRPTNTPVIGGESSNRLVVEGIENTTSNQRGLSLERDLPVQYLSRGMAAALWPEVAPTRAPRDQRALDAVMAALDFVYQPRLSGTITDRVEALVPELSGFYDESTGTLTIITEAQQLTVPERQNLPHYYMHALQDQRWGLAALRAAAGTLDRRLALEALIQGDAVVTMGTVSPDPPKSTEEWLDLARRAQAFERLDLQAPNPATAQGEIDSFCYLQGTQFALAVKTASGWRGLSQLYSSPPISTRQIMHPAQLGAVPQGLYLTDLSPWLGGTWGLEAQDTIGEFVLGLHLRETLAPGQPVNRDRNQEQRAWDAVAGWDGDLIHVYQAGERRAWLLLTAWDSQKEAGQFFDAYKDVIRLKLGAGASEVETTDTSTQWQNGQLYGYMSRQGAQVLVVWAPDRQVLDLILGRLISP